MFLRNAESQEFPKEKLETKAYDLIFRFEEDSEQFYNNSHDLWRGLNEIGKGNFE